MGQIYFYCNNADKKEAIRQTAGAVGVQAKEIGPKDLVYKIGHIVGMSKSAEKDSTVPMFYNMPEVMLFGAFTNAQLDGFLAEYKKTGAEPIMLKAVVTPFNASWSLYQLIQELKQEHTAMNGR